MMKKKKEKTNLETDQMIKILFYTLAFLAFMYVMTAIITGEIKLGRKKDEPLPVTIQYEQILAGETFERPEAEYYVIFYKFSDAYASVIETVIANYKNKENAVKVYQIDLDNYFNISIYDELGATKNINTSNINELKVANYTLIKIQNKINVLAIESKDQIKEYLER